MIIVNISRNVDLRMKPTVPKNLVSELWSARVLVRDFAKKNALRQILVHNI
jgi:hypothetical protein